MDRKYFVMIDFINEDGSGLAIVRAGNTGTKGLVGGPEGVEWEQYHSFKDHEKAVDFGLALAKELSRPLSIHSIWKHVHPKLYEKVQNGRKT